MSPGSLAEVLAAHPETRVVIPVHFAGLPCDMPAIKAAADAAGAVVIEDALTRWEPYPTGSRVGSCAHSVMTVFSFHPVKVIAAGEGGMITTNDKTVYRRLLRLRSHGINKLDDPFELPDRASQHRSALASLVLTDAGSSGITTASPTFQCALALSQARKLDTFIRAGGSAGPRSTTPAFAASALPAGPGSDGRDAAATTSMSCASISGRPARAAPKS